MKIKIVLLASMYCALPMSLYAMEDPGERARQIAESSKAKKAFENLSLEELAALKVDAQDAIDDLSNPEYNAKAILAKVNQEAAKERLDERNDVIDRVKWQDTLLTSKHSLVGLYKRDLIEVPLQLADIAADVMLYRELLKRRVDAICTSIKDDYNTFIGILEQVIQVADELEVKQQAGYFTRLFGGGSVSYAPLTNYIYAKHFLVGALPMNKEIFVPLLARWGWGKASDSLHSSYIVDPRNAETSEGDISVYNDKNNRGLGRKAYLPDENGHLQASDKTPFSVSSVLRGAQFLLNPVLKFGSSATIGGLRLANSVFNLYIPEVLLSDNAQTVYDFMGMGFAAKIFDRLVSSRWQAFVIEKKAKFVLRLRAYKKAVENPNVNEEELKNAEQKLKKLVEKGHSSSSWLPTSLLQQWRAAKNIGDHSITSYTALWVMLVSSYKAWGLYKTYGV